MEAATPLPSIFYLNELCDITDEVFFCVLPAHQQGYLRKRGF